MFKKGLNIFSKDYPKDICKNNGICATKNGNISCRCYKGHTGQYCEKEANECLEHENPCNGGICIEKFLDYECDCPKGLDKMKFINIIHLTIIIFE